MAARIDISLDSNGDFPITLATIPYVYSDKQHIIDRFNAAPGWWKQYPNSGINVRQYLKASGSALSFLKINATLQLKADGYNVGNMLFGNRADGTLVIAPNATRV